ncbi:putative GATA transcription factor 22 [Magnolia sinica]|uniref:putative GATA transcription factor 22 n=1 Tax=Magnolia sinica TaxID=86752 RepID=UPI002659782A|nr:putative GATA transcription factor 22 [Magnolia sinica]
MTPTYLTSASPLPVGEGNEDDNHVFFIQTSQVSSSSCPVFFNPTQGQEKGDHDGDQTLQQHKKHQENEADGRFQIVDDNDNHHSFNHSIPKQADQDRDQCNNGPVKWMSSKMRFMRKMMNSDQTPEKSQPLDDENNNNNATTIRVCSDCNTTKTPLWRSGPRGPKSLCNACGIRQRKARRAMAAASSGIIASSTSSNKVSKEKRLNCNHTNQHKKRCKITAPRSWEIRFEEFTISLSKNSAFHRVFPQDEKDAAILLMALSCGLVHG